MAHCTGERRLAAIMEGLGMELRWLADQLRRPLRMLLAQLWGSGRHHLPLPEALARLWAATALRAELVELSGLLLERTDHLVAPLA